jgi:hypothetical protein
MASNNGDKGLGCSAVGAGVSVAGATFCCDSGSGMVEILLKSFDLPSL